MLSLPSRERGLKYNPCGESFRTNLSLPSRERGLKLDVSHASYPLGSVAPLAGAWIEIYQVYREPKVDTTSLPSRERGLKFALCIHCKARGFVAPLAGAWIEIPTCH